MTKFIGKSGNQSTVGGSSKDTMFVQADSACFREVQRLTRISDYDENCKTVPAPIRRLQNHKSNRYLNCTSVDNSKGQT